MISVHQPALGFIKPMFLLSLTLSHCQQLTASRPALLSHTHGWREKNEKKLNPTWSSRHTTFISPRPFRMLIQSLTRKRVGTALVKSQDAGWKAMWCTMSK